MERTNYEAWRAGLAADLPGGQSGNKAGTIGQILDMAWFFVDLTTGAAKHRAAPVFLSICRPIAVHFPWGSRHLARHQRSGSLPQLSAFDWQWTSLTIGSCWVLTMLTGHASLSWRVLTRFSSASWPSKSSKHWHHIYSELKHLESRASLVWWTLPVIAYIYISYICAEKKNEILFGFTNDSEHSHHCKTQLGAERRGLQHVWRVSLSVAMIVIFDLWPVTLEIRCTNQRPALAEKGSFTVPKHSFGLRGSIWFMEFKNFKWSKA